MSDDRPDDSPQPPSDEQRLALLEQSHRLNRLILIILSVALTMALASWATWGVVSLMADQADSVDGSQIAALHTQIEASAKQIEALQQQLTQLRTTASQPAPAPTPGKADDRAALQQVGAVLIAQEQSFQRSLVALKHGMRDLAGMIAGSRSWL
ncbi:hypothetical protein HP532_19670, partial [Pseudomonas sp. CrR25]|nr:hypothetical protein [Pseudomonas sp. CrR25]